MCSLEHELLCFKHAYGLCSNYSIIVIGAVASLVVKDGIRLKLLIGVDGRGYEILSLCSAIVSIILKM